MHLPWHDRDTDDLPIFDTPLHPPIELADFEKADGELVIYHPGKVGGSEHLVSDIHIDTYDAR